jgi:alpha-tubulin suppressor-like RCC1 family protein
MEIIMLESTSPIRMLSHAAFLGALLTLGACADEPMAPREAGVAPQALVLTAGIESKAVSAGWYHTCAIKADDTLACWGDNSLGQLTIPAGVGTVKQLSAGGRHSCVVKADDSVACWTYNFVGQSTVPAGLGTVKQIAAGLYHTCAIKTDDSLACWGYPGFAAVPAALGAVKQVSLGNFHTCAIKADDTLACWIENAAAQATMPADLGTVKQVAAGAEHTCAIKTDGSLVCWGSNTSLQTTIPVDLGTVDQVAGGAYHTCAVRTDGTLACWGGNGNGQRTIPAHLGVVSKVEAGEYHTCAIRTDGILMCWGNNDNGQTTVPTEEGHHFLPSATFVAPATARPGQLFALELSGAGVNTPGGTISAAEAGIKYAFDCGDGAGYGTFSSSTTVNCTAGAVGPQLVKGKVQDEDGDEREYSASLSVVDAAPAGPASIVVTSAFSPTQVLTVSWPNVENENSYLLERRSRPDGGAWSGFTPLSNNPANTTSYEDASVSQSTTYQYRVRACNAAGCSASIASTPFSAGVAPTAPIDLTATGTGLGTINLGWTNNFLYTSSFVIQRRRQDATWTPYATIASQPSYYWEYSDTGLQAKVHQYRVRACNPVGCSAWVSSRKVLANAAPVAPTNVVASALSSTSVQVTWTDASNNETGFTLYRRTYNGTSYGPWTSVATPAANATSATDNTVVTGTTYQYRLRAANALGASAAVNSNAVTTP